LQGYTVTTYDDTVKSPSENPIILLTGDYPEGSKIGTTTTEVTVTGAIPLSGMLYVTIHLDYGLEKTTGWDGTDLNADGKYDIATMGSLQIGLNTPPYTQPYDFSYSTDGTSDNATPMSFNEFKKNPGVNGMALQKDTGNPKANVNVELWGPTGTFIMGTNTDQDGVYILNYKHTGKAATYAVKVPAYGLQQNVTLKANGYGIVIFDTLP
jgi:hypothetical protein